MTFAVRGRSTYVLDGSAASQWIPSNAAADATGGHLVTLTSAAEAQFVTRFFEVGFWIGLTDAAQEGRFVWVTGEPFRYSNWAIGQPDDRSGNTGGSEDYVHTLRITFQNGRWNDNLSDDTNLTSGYVVEFNTPGEFRGDTNPYAGRSSRFEGSEIDDRMAGGAGRDTLLGFEGNDVIRGNGQADVLDGGAGDDLLTGGNGADDFVFVAADGAGADTIRDFDATEGDRLVLDGFGFADAAAVLAAASATAEGVTIALGGGASIEVLGVALDALGAEDIVLV